MARYEKLGGPTIRFRCRICGGASSVMTLRDEPVVEALERMEAQHLLVSPDCQAEVFDLVIDCGEDLGAARASHALAQPLSIMAFDRLVAKNIHLRAAASPSAAAAVGAASAADGASNGQ